MAAGGKKPIKAEMKIYPMKEMDKPSRAAIDGNAKLKKLFAVMTYSEMVEVDPRKWNAKSLAEGMANVARYELKLLATSVSQSVTNDAKTFEKEATASYKRYEKIIIDKVSKALDEIKDDKGDNKKAFKEGKDLFEDLDRAGWAKLFADPTKAITDALTLLVRAAEKAGDNPAGSRKAQLAAQKVVKSEIGNFGKSRSVVNDAVGTLDKLTKELRKNDEVAPELTEFGKILTKHGKVFDTVLDECNAYEKVLQEIDKALEVDEIDDTDAKKLFIQIRSMSGPEKAAKAAASMGKKLKVEFTAIKKKLT